MKILKTFLLVLTLITAFSICVFADGGVTTITSDSLTVIDTDNVYISNGKSADYNINVVAGSTYVIKLVGKSSATIGYYDYHTVEIRLDGKMLRVINIPLGESENDVFAVETRPFTLPSGEHKISVVPRAGGSGIYMNKLVFDPMLMEEEKGTGAYKSISLPSVIEAEDFDYATWYASDNVNDSRIYRKNTGIDIYTVDSDEYYIELKDGEYTEYTFANQNEGVFAFSVFCFGGEGVNVYFDDYETPLYVPSNERIGNSREVNLFIPQGSHTIRMKASGKVIKLDNISFRSSDGDYITLDRLGDFHYTEEETEHSVYKNLYVANEGKDSNNGEENAPFATLFRAKEEVAKLAPSMTGDIVVNIASGYYELDEAEVFDVSHSGQNGYNVIFRGADKNSPPVISGGKRVMILYLCLCSVLPVMSLRQIIWVSTRKNRTITNGWVRSWHQKYLE